MWKKKTMDHSTNRTGYRMRVGVRLLFVLVWLVGYLGCSPRERERQAEQRPSAGPAGPASKEEPLVYQWHPLGYVLVRPKINAQDAGWFVLDSGAGAPVITQAAAERIGLPQVSRARIQGIAGPANVPVYQAGMFTLGPVRVAGQQLAGADIAGLGAMLKMEISGVCGREVFSRLAVEMDSPNKKLALYQPTTYHLQGAPWTELYTISDQVFVCCRFDGNEGLFRLDTGALPGLMFHGAAVKKFGLLKDRKTESVSGAAGIGGKVPLRAGRLSTFHIGNSQLDGFYPAYFMEDESPQAGPFIVGNIGLQLLTKMKVVFDVPNQRVAFVWPK